MTPYKQTCDLTQAQDNPVRIAALGMDEHMQHMFDMVFQKQAKGAYRLVGVAEAEACIFDLDGFGAEALWQKHCGQHPQMPTLALSLHAPPKLHSDWFLKKPIKINELLMVLVQLSDQVKSQRVPAVAVPPALSSSTPKVLSLSPVQARPSVSRIGALHNATQNLEQTYTRQFASYAGEVVCGNRPDIDPQNEAAVASISYDRSRRFQGILEQALTVAKQQQCRVCLSGAMGEVILNPEQNRVLSTTQEDALGSLMLMPMQRAHIKTVSLSAAELGSHIKAANLPFYHYFLDQFLWKVAIWTSHGRVPIDTPLRAPIVLRHWPNFTRLMITPQAMRIAALWIDSPMSLIDTARVLDIPQRYVFTFYSAVQAVGLAFPDRRSMAQAAAGLPFPDRRSEKNAEESQALNVSPSKRSLFKRILSHLHLTEREADA